MYQLRIGTNANLQLTVLSPLAGVHYTLIDLAVDSPATTLEAPCGFMLFENPRVQHEKLYVKYANRCGVKKYY